MACPGGGRLDPADPGTEKQPVFTADTSVLSSNVLVLNRHWAAIRVVSARRAFCMIFKEIAEIITCEDKQYQSYDFESWRELSEFRSKYQREHHDWVRCVRFELAVPRIIRLLVYERLPAPASSSPGGTSTRETATAASTAASGSPPAS